MAEGKFEAMQKWIVHSSACSAQLFQNHRIQFWDHFLKSWCAKVAKAVLGVHTLQLSHRSGRKSRFARQPVMGHLMVMMSLKLCNSNCFVSRCTQKIDPLFEDFEEMQSIFLKGHMKSRLDGKSLYSLGFFVWNCLLVFVCWLLLMAKFDCCMRCSGRQTSRPLQLPTWKHTLARPMSLSKQRLGDDLGAFVPVWSSIHHNSCRIT